MATAASQVMRPKRIRRSKQKPRLVVIEGGKELSGEDAKSWSLSASVRFRARQAERRIGRAQRSNETPERQSVAIAMLAVEERLVKAFWTIARQPVGNISPISGGRCGIDYIPERGDLNGYVDAAGGLWHSAAPRPAIPSGKEIDAANEALDWLLHVDEARRRILVVGATSKRGDVGRQINWIRLRPSLPQFHDLSARTLQGRYRESLRIIVTELTLARLAM